METGTGRVCKLCGHEKILYQFSFKKDGKDGRSSRCKTCAAVRQALYRSSPEGMAVAQAYYADHPEYRGRKLEKLARWRQEHPERVRAVQQAYRRTPLAKALRARRDAVIGLERAKTPEDRARWDQKIHTIDCYVKTCRIRKQEKINIA
jgi:hypothetical protein